MFVEPIFNLESIFKFKVTSHPKLSSVCFIHLTTPQKRSILGNLIVPQLIERFPAFFYSSLHDSQQPACVHYFEPDQSNLRPISSRSITMSTSQLCLRVPSGLFRSEFQTKNLYAFIFTVYICKKYKRKKNFAFLL